MAIASSYDYIIVGAGSAGCVLARRLIETTEARVLLLEAGGPDDAAGVHRTDMGSMTALWSDDAAVWRYRTEPQYGLGGRRVDIPQGRVLGGGSSVNAMMHVRGHCWDFDHWYSLGNDGWAYRDVLPWFVRSENVAGIASDRRGADGPLSVLPYPQPSPVSAAFVAAAEERGYGPLNPDYNDPQQSGGAFYYQSTRTTRDRRCSTADAYLAPVRRHARLDVVTGALVSRIVLEGDRAAGVEYRKDGIVQQAGAGAEVIVTAGAIGTPKILMLSGIGPASQLRGMDIEPRVDLPGVGRNLHDHLLFGVAYESREPQPQAQLLAEAGLFCSGAPGLDAGRPDLQFFFGPIQFVAEQYRTDGPAFTFAPILVRPESRGSVTLRSTDPAQLPVVDPGYLSRQVDVDLLLLGLEVSRDLAATGALAPFRGRELAPGDDVVDRDALVRFVRANASTVWHPVGTCRMGVDDDAVVSPRLTVHGVRGLRVADASVMPAITSGNTNASTVMIAEKAADMIVGGPAPISASDHRPQRVAH